MNTRTSKSNLPWLLASLVFVPGLLVGLAGCKDNARLADHDVRSREVQSITAYGKVLDEKAPPIDVVYVFLKAVLDDYDAGKDVDKREEAFNTQLGVLATQKIKQIVSGRNLTEQQQLERFYSAVRRFAPVLGHYREDFRADYETLTGQMFMRETPKRGESAGAIVLVNLNHPDPTQRPGGNAVARIDLVREKGFWRIWWVSFNNASRDWNAQMTRQQSNSKQPGPGSPP